MDSYFRVLINRAKCLRCNDVVQSQFTHDCMRCKCGNVMVDGGTSYIRHGYKVKALVQDCSVYRMEPENAAPMGNFRIYGGSK
jgi:hypothetical protein